MKCEIIKDLLPSYIDDLTSMESNIEIEEHLKQCPKCQKYFKSMSEGIEFASAPDKSIDPFLKIRQSQLRMLVLAIIITISIVCVGFDAWHSYWNNGTSTFSTEMTISCTKNQDLTQIIFTPTAERTSFTVGYSENKEVNGILPLKTLHVIKYHEKAGDDNIIYQGTFDMIFVDKNSFIDLNTYPSIKNINPKDVIAVEYMDKTLLINACDLYNGQITITN